MKHGGGPRKISHEDGTSEYESIEPSNLLVNNNFECKVIREKRDQTGNFLALDMELEDAKITLINIYVPYLW